MDNNSTGLYKWSSVAASTNGPDCESKLVYSFSLNESELNKNNCSWCGSNLLTEHDSKTYHFQNGPPNVTEAQMLSQCNICGWYLHKRNKNPRRKRRGI